MNLFKRHWPAFGLAFVLFAITGAAAFAQEVTSDAHAINEVPTDMLMWSALVGFFMPSAIAVINRYRWTSQTKGIVAFVISIAAAAGTAFFSGDLTSAKDVTSAALVVFSSAIVSYQTWWKPSGIAPSIEKATG